MIEPKKSLRISMQGHTSAEHPSGIVDLKIGPHPLRPDHYVMHVPAEMQGQVIIPWNWLSLDFRKNIHDACGGTGLRMPPLPRPSRRGGRPRGVKVKDAAAG